MCGCLIVLHLRHLETFHAKRPHELLRISRDTSNGHVSVILLGAKEHAGLLMSPILLARCTARCGRNEFFFGLGSEKHCPSVGLHTKTYIFLHQTFRPEFHQHA